MDDRPAWLGMRGKEREPMMRLKLKYRNCVLLVGLATAILCQIISVAAAQELTIAERTLFLDKHFSDTGKQEIDYLFQQKAGDIAGFSGKATVEVHGSHPDGTASVTTRFLSDEHAVPIPPIEHAAGNPVILGFLESDIAKMKRLTGGSTNYFRKRIRLALAATDVRIREISVRYKDRNVPAKEITVFPYTEEPQRKRLGQYAQKAYVFITSVAVPGEVYCMFTMLSGSMDQAADSSMTIVGGDPKQCKSQN